MEDDLEVGHDIGPIPQLPTLLILIFLLYLLTHTPAKYLGCLHLPIKILHAKVITRLLELPTTPRESLIQ